MVRQFDVYPNPSDTSATFAPFIVALQSHHLNPIDTVVVAPMVRDAQTALAPLDAPLEFNGELLVIAIAEIGVVGRNLLRRKVGDASAHEDAIRRALERLFTGF